jgi:hypothetical protein
MILSCRSLPSFRPKARFCRAEAEESISTATPKANQKVKIIYLQLHYFTLLTMAVKSLRLHPQNLA